MHHGSTMVLRSGGDDAGRGGAGGAPLAWRPLVSDGAAGGARPPRRASAPPYRASQLSHHWPVSLSLEAVRPEIQQYFIESNVDAYPIARELRSIVYQRAKGALETQPFGTQRDVYRVGYEWAAHSLEEVKPLQDEPQLEVGGPECSKP